MIFHTKILKPTEDNLSLAAKTLQDGEVIGIPTETVYGLAANIYNDTAIKKIFQVKGRPEDNPLIIHISNLKQLDNLIIEKTDLAKKLIKLYWPGPLTLIFKKSGLVSDTISAGLDTVAIRFPSHYVAQMLIEKSGFPLAAPSANISGSPSPTSSQHVYNDFQGKIPYILDGGHSTIGLESTVLSLATTTPTLLRPGKITIEELKKDISNLVIHSSVFNDEKKIIKAIAPGMKYKHYSPRAEVRIFNGSTSDYCNYLNKLNETKKTWALCFDEDINHLNTPYISYGKENDFSELAQNFFSSLRLLDEKKADFVIAHGPKKEGLGLSIYNRLLRSADFKIINTEEDLSFE